MRGVFWYLATEQAVLSGLVVSDKNTVEQVRVGTPTLEDTHPAENVSALPHKNLVAPVVHLLFRD